MKNILIKDEGKDGIDFQIIVANEGKIVKKNNKNYLILLNGEILVLIIKKFFKF